jgi:hypothetical protein
VPAPFKALAKDAPGDSETKRVAVTVTAFVAYQLDSLIGIYAPNRAEVAARAIEEWLSQNGSEIAIAKAQYADFLKSSKEPSSEGS